MDRIRVDVEQKAKLITFSGDRGSVIGAIANGRVFASVTNLSTHESMRLNITGTAFYDDEGNLVLGTGRWIIYLPGAILFLIGRLEFAQEPYGVSPRVVHGQSSDLCTTLA